MTTTNYETHRERKPPQVRTLRRILLPLIILMAVIGFVGSKVGEAKSEEAVKRLQFETEAMGAQLAGLKLENRTLLRRGEILTAENKALTTNSQKIRGDNDQLRRRMAEQGKIVRETTFQLRQRMRRAIPRNVAGGMVGNVPIVGDAADAAATAVDVVEYRKMIDKLDHLERSFPTPKNKVVRHHTE